MEPVYLLLPPWQVSPNWGRTHCGTNTSIQSLNTHFQPLAFLNQTSSRSRYHSDQEDTIINQFVLDSKRGGDQMTSGSSDITPTHTIPTQSAAVKLIKNLKINNATHRHFYFLSAPEGTSKNQDSQHPAAKRSTSPNNLVQISCTGNLRHFSYFRKHF